ncbi:alpha-ketoglutarate-dependent dioxygenase FTO [Micropterus salmoides]|uniref:alpha-ketoglutarate-dependent dioxygenase FTO n=1 Tax=Micropterus salmoides TaxID=27706 RepID=UPI0018EA664F|nr:alpha-ketoglutarate-dependent dioxygenase FTO [Micropterus salmoides]XP_045888792.1 alpha-ketoglutarate-dependent dioxygenase FTO [Micropterus dolomieu]
MKARQCKHNSRNMKRSGDSEGEKRTKRRRLLQELGNQKIPFLGPSNQGFQQLWDSSYSGLVLRRSCSLPTELHGRVQAALLTLRRKGCLLRDLVRVRERDVFTAVSRALLGEPGHTYRYLDTRLFAIPWHSEDIEVKGQNCCDPDFRAACKALWELNTFFCSDVSQLKEGDRLTQCVKGGAEAKQIEEGDTESKHSEDSKNSEGGDSESRQSEEGDTESKHSEEWDIESKHSEEGCSGSKQEGEWETESKHSSEEGESSQVKPCVAAGSEHSEGKFPGWAPKVISGTETEPVGPGAQKKPVAQLKHSLPDYHIEDKEEQASGQGCSQPSPVQVYTGPVKFNVTLLNYMDPAAMSQLKEEPYYGMGKMAVGWHHDENLISHSPVAVYSYSCHDDKGESSEGSSGEKACWRIGLKVAWDIHTPGLMLPLESGDCYYMRDDLNSTHQHCVLAGDTARFSSTHRVAECSSGTLTYIQSQCQEALSNLHTDPETGSHSLLALLPTTLQRCEEIHNEVEFEWLRQYWFQGQRYARFCSWWTRPMEQLEKNWRLMETMTMLFLATVEEEGQAQEGRREMAETLLSALTDRHQQRQTWRDRCHSSLAQTLPPEEAPVDRPFWGVDDPSMPLPFDLADIINRVESLLWRM